MPLYDYTCQACSHVFEARHPIVGSPPPCPNCGSGRLHKGICMPGVNQMRGTDNDLQKLDEHVAHSAPPEKQRVHKLLNQMKPTPENVFSGHDNCIKHTREELEDRYGKIFPKE